MEFNSLKFMHNGIKVMVMDMVNKLNLVHISLKVMYINIKVMVMINKLNLVHIGIKVMLF